MVTLKIEAPEVERRIRELAAARQMDAEQYLMDLVTAQLSAVTSAPVRELDPRERIDLLRRWAERHPTDAPLISEEALSRDQLYADRDS